MYGFTVAANVTWHTAAGPLLCREIYAAMLSRRRLDRIRIMLKAMDE